jgi:hypothetical protein
VVPLLQRLLELLKALQPGPRTSPDALRDLMRALAARAIQEDPAQGVIPPGDWPPEVVDAIEEGARQAATLNAAGIRLQIELEDLPIGTPAGGVTDRRSAAFGPFVDTTTGRVLRFSTYESRELLAVIRRPGIAPPEILLLIPLDSTADDATNQTWTLPPGSVWIRTRLLAAGAPDFAGVRISGGTLRLTGAVTRTGNQLFLTDLAPWTLSVDPEQPRAAVATASDSDRLTIVLPSTLVVHAAAPTEVGGDASLSGFGSGLTFTPDATPPSVSGGLLCFPLTPADTAWSIQQNLSPTVQFAGDAQPASAQWALPMSGLGVGSITEAPHGGSLVVRLNGEVRGAVAGQAGPRFTWFASTLTANALRLDFDGLQVAPGGRDAIDLWTKTSSTFVFAQQPVARAIFRSEAGGEDAVAILGGMQRNRWDLPRQADGVPFGFEGRIDVFGLLAYETGFVLTCLATSDPEPDTAGLALENLYFVVRQPRRCALAAALTPDLDTAPSGISILFFDTDFALPTLPDPYAGNAGVPERGQVAEDSVRVVMRWADGNAPALAVHLTRDVRFPRSQVDQIDDPDEELLYGRFRGYLDAERERLYLLDLSSREHLFGVALEAPGDLRPEITDNRLSMPLHRVRLLLQPQVHWEPVWIEPNPLVPQLKAGIATSWQAGGPTLVGARDVKLVPTLPALLSEEIVGAIRGEHRAAALFSLPFGLRAMARLSPDEPVEGGGTPPGIDTRIHEPGFGAVRSARQIRLTARNTQPALGDDPSRYMPGMLRQLKNLNANASALDSVLPAELRDQVNSQFADRIPLHRADLSGYGLSAFSEWKLDADAGCTKAHFQVLNGRTAYEVLQFRSALYECGARVVRTITLERRNSAAVILTDSGWVPIEDGRFERPLPYEKGAVRAFRNLRRIRITGPSFAIGPDAAVQPVIFDADAEIEGLEGGGAGGTVPIVDRPGYVQVKPPPPPPPQPPPPAPQGASLLTSAQVRKLFETVGPITSPVNCSARIGGTLGHELSSITSDLALDDGNTIGFAVAAVGSPRLPRAGQWTAVRIDLATSEAVPVDQRRGVPIVRNGLQPFVFREPADARRTQARVRYGLMMATQSSRALFPQPKIDPAQAGRILFDPPLLADPYSLVQSTSAFPRASYALRLNETPTFNVTPDNTWRIQNPTFTFADPAGDLLKGGEWAMSRGYDHIGPIRLAIDSAAAAPWNIQIPPAVLDVDFPMLPAGLQKIFKIRTNYLAESGGLPKLAKPTLEFIGALKEVKEIVDTLSKLADLGFDFDVNVSAGSGASPSFVVQMQLIFRIGKPTERIDIGVGKFFGQFLVQGNLEIATTGLNRPRLFLEFQGDIQQGILPPLLYAGGLFRFGIDVPESGRPVVHLAMGVVASIGGDLIPGLLEVEVTVHYGYTLIPETLEPGVLLGLDARAKLLGGLVGFSFGVEAMARIKRLDANGVRIWAQIRVAATVQVAIFIEEEVDFETQFEQTLPLELAAFIPGVGLLGLAPALARA